MISLVSVGVSVVFKCLTKTVRRVQYFFLLLQLDIHIKKGTHATEDESKFSYFEIVSTLSRNSA